MTNPMQLHPLPPREYIERFVYRLDLKLGPVYSSQYKEFEVWCHARLGIKYKDWCITTAGKGVYTLHCTNNKWATFLALTWVDMIV